MRPANGLGTGFGKTEMPYFTFLDKLFHRIGSTSSIGTFEPTGRW